VSYQRFVENQIRKVFGFESVPVTVTYKAREREPRQAPTRRKGDR
jgi:predicted GTPase